MMRLEDLLNPKPIGLTEPTEGDLELPEYLVTDPILVGYPDVEMQREIYTWVLQDLPILGSVIDFGAGRGDFQEFLHEINPAWEYTGYEITPGLVAAAIQAKRNVQLQDVLTLDTDNLHAEWVVCIGTLNYSNRSEENGNFEKFLAKALELNPKGITFILLSKDDAGMYSTYSIPLMAQFLDEGGYIYKIDNSVYDGIYKLTIIANNLNFNQ